MSVCVCVCVVIGLGSRLGAMRGTYMGRAYVQNISDMHGKRYVITHVIVTPNACSSTSVPVKAALSLTITIRAWPHDRAQLL